MWVKIDDQFPTHPKVIRAGLEGRALFVTSLCYSAQHLTNGFIPNEVTPLLTATSGVTDALPAIEKLVTVGLWELCEGGYMIHDFLVYNPPADKIIEKRRKNADRQARFKSSHNAKSNGVSNGVSNTTPVPVPVPDNNSSGKPEKPRKKKQSDPRSASVEIQLFKSITGKYPKSINYDEVISAIAGKSQEYLLPFYREWCGRSYNPGSIKWLTEWAASGSIPPNNGINAKAVRAIEAQPAPRKVYQ